MGTPQKPPRCPCPHHGTGRDHPNPGFSAFPWNVPSFSPGIPGEGKAAAPKLWNSLDPGDGFHEDGRRWGTKKRLQNPRIFLGFFLGGDGLEGPSWNVWEGFWKVLLELSPLPDVFQLPSAHSRISHLDASSPKFIPVPPFPGGMNLLEAPGGCRAKILKIPSRPRDFMEFQPGLSGKGP